MIGRGHEVDGVTLGDVREPFEVFVTRHTFEARYTKIKVFDHFRKLWWSFTDLKKGLEKNFENFNIDSDVRTLSLS